MRCAYQTSDRADIRVTAPNGRAFGKQIIILNWIKNTLPTAHSMWKSERKQSSRRYQWAATAKKTSCIRVIFALIAMPPHKIQR